MIDAGYLPTPEEIKLACEAIQATWSDEVELHRRTSYPQATGTTSAEVIDQANEALNDTLHRRRRTVRRLDRRTS